MPPQADRLAGVPFAAIEPAVENIPRKGVRDGLVQSSCPFLGEIERHDQDPHRCMCIAATSLDDLFGNLVEVARTAAKHGETIADLLLVRHVPALSHAARGAIETTSHPPL